MELFPIDDFPFREDAERQEELRKAFLQCWEEMQQEKKCGFCVEPKQKELLDHNNIPESVYNCNIKESKFLEEQLGQRDQVQGKVDLITLSGQHRDRMSDELEQTGSVPAWWKGVATISITAIEDFQKTIQDNQLREAAERVVAEYYNHSLCGKLIESAILELEKALK